MLTSFADRVDLLLRLATSSLAPTDHRFIRAAQGSTTEPADEQAHDSTVLPT